MSLIRGLRPRELRAGIPFFENPNCFSNRISHSVRSGRWRPSRRCEISIDGFMIGGEISLRISFAANRGIIRSSRETWSQSLRSGRFVDNVRVFFRVSPVQSPSHLRFQAKF